MALMRSLWALALLLALGCSADKVDVTPLQKVVTMLEDMAAKGANDMQREKVQMAAFTEWCSETLANVQNRLVVNRAKLDLLLADTLKAQSDISGLKDRITSCQADINTSQKQLDEATKARAGTKATFDQTFADYSQSLDALEMAINSVKNSETTVDAVSVPSFLQLSAGLDPPSPAEALDLLDGFLQRRQEGGAFAQSFLTRDLPVAHAYEAQVGGIVNMLKDLSQKFGQERLQAEKNEQDSIMAYDLVAQGLKNAMTQSQKNIDDYTKEMNSRSLDLQVSQAEEKDVQAAYNQDSSVQTDTSTTCNLKQTEFSSRQNLRQNEIRALNQALNVLKGKAVAGNAEKYLPQQLVQVVQQDAGTSLATLRGVISTPNQEQAVRFLFAQASKLRSRMLSALAVRVEADPLAKVKKMISDLVTRLAGEAAEEQTQDTFCQGELSSNEATRTTKANLVSTTKAHIDGLRSDINALTTTMSQLTESLADLTATLANATGMRTTESNNNKKAIADAQDAQQAVAQAIEVLQEFYAANGQALIQASSSVDPVAPKIFDDKDFGGMTDQSTGVIGLLQVVQSDFARLEAETKADEAKAKTAYQKLQDEIALDETLKQEEYDHSVTLKNQKQTDLNSAETDLLGTQSELDAASRYFEDLKKQCFAKEITFAERAAARKAEIDALQEALAILSSQTE